MVKGELVSPYREKREHFAVPNDWKVMTLLTGDSRDEERNEEGSLGRPPSLGYNSRSEATLRQWPTQLRESRCSPEVRRSAGLPSMLFLAGCSWNWQRRSSLSEEALHRKKRREIKAMRHNIKHPDFRNFNAGQAEQYLAGRPKGDVIIQPSYKGPDHLVVTWKVDDGLYQHIGGLEALEALQLVPLPATGWGAQA